MADRPLSLFDPDTLDAQRANRWREPHWDLVRQLIFPGVNIVAIAALLEIAGASPEQVAYFAGPIVVHQLGGDHVPDQLALAIRLDRFDAVREECAAGIIGDLAVPSDLAALLMTASLAAPLATEYADIFTWATHTTVGEARLGSTAG